MMLVVLYAVIREKGKGVYHVGYGMFFFLMCFWVVLSLYNKTYKT